MKAKFLSLNARDFIKGAIVAVFTAIASFLYETINQDEVIDLLVLKRIGMIALAAFISYLAKNLFSNSNDQFLTKEK